MVSIQNKHIFLLAFLFLFVGFLATINITGSSIFNIFTGQATSNNGYRYAYYTCYDGISSSEGGPTSCKSYETWKQYANNFCVGHCKKYLGSQRCGVYSFRVKNGCSTLSMPKCSSGQYRCEKDTSGKYTNWAQKCDSNGNWYNAVYCTYGCDSMTGQCTQPIEKCRGDLASCSYNSQCCTNFCYSGYCRY